MAEDSALWEGNTVGDAASTDVWSARYSAAEFSDIFSKLFAGNQASGYVIPRYGNNLAVTANNPAAMNVLLDTGAAFVRGRMYENTASLTLTIAAADATNPRLDRVVLRVSLSESLGQTIRAAVLTGTPSATPALPSLTQNATTYEVPIARIWVAAAAVSIAATEVHDERVFVPTFDHGQIRTDENLIRNSEFMAYSARGPISGASATTPPDYWDLVGTPTDFTGFAAVGGSFSGTGLSRGRIFRFQTDAASEGMSQTFPVKPSTTYVIKGLVGVATAIGQGPAVVIVTTNSASPGTVTKYERRTIAASGLMHTQQIVYTTEADATTMTVKVLSLAAISGGATNGLWVGQFIAVEGFIPGPYRQFHETLIFNKANIGDSSWDTTAKSSGNTTINLTTSFGGYIMPGTQGLFLYGVGNDSGSAAGTPAMAVFNANALAHGLRILLGGVTNDVPRAANGYIALSDPNNLASGIFVNIVASGASTFDALIRIVGIIT